MPKRRRRSLTPQFKAQIVLEVLSGQESQAEVARQHQRKPDLIARWKEIALEGLEGHFQGGQQWTRTRTASMVARGCQASGSRRMWHRSPTSGSADGR